MMADKEQDHQTLEDIWADDVFNRKDEAISIIAYLESVARRPRLDKDSAGHTLAIDAGYGIGKSFFLRHLADHLRINHPVAFVDAWKDDLADEPMTALAATLQSALEPLRKEIPHFGKKWDAVLHASGRIASLVAIAVAKRAAGKVIDLEAVAEIAKIFAGDTDTRKILDDGSKGAGKEIVESVTKGLSLAASHRLMQEKIAAFKEGQQAITDLKASLGALVLSLDANRHFPPIVIIVDELDRCRPTYAVKLLEEIKHLFDVPGIIFVFGLHGAQLANSIASAYGPKFDAPDYLRRFINRTYSLRAPNLTPLLEDLFRRSGIDSTRLLFPAVKVGTKQSEAEPASTIVARYMEAYELSARDAFQVVDALQTCLALASMPLFMGLLLPLIISNRFKGKAAGALEKPNINQNWMFVLDTDGATGKEYMASMYGFANEMMEKLQNNMSIAQVANGSPVIMWALRANQNILNSNDFSHPKKYARLIETVGRFSFPAQMA